METLEARRLFAFGLTTTATSYTVDTGAGLTFSILRGGTLSSTIHLGDLTSVKLNGTELLAPYSATSRYSHYEQGLSSTTILTAEVDPAGNWIKITCDDTVGGPSGGITHYYVARKGENNIYMASLPDDVTLSPGEGRYLAYLQRSVFTNIEQPSNISNNIGAVEGSDVFFNADGTTASKFYNNGRRMIENEVHGVTGNGFGAYMHMGNREHSAGGPFFKDHDFQTTGGATEIYNVLFSGHTQTEAYRQGLQGPYALQFTTGAVPAAPNYAFLEGVGISGLIPAAQRGSVAGIASGIPAGREAVVTLTNAAAQYWEMADPATGAFSMPGVRPGTYTMTLYDNELAVGTRTITIAAGQTTPANITSTYFTPAATWRIGTWDGTPLGFLNADKIEVMHPSDVRMASWTSTPNFTIGTNTASQWPMAQFVNVNNAQRITFNLTAAQAAAAQTLRIGITLGFEGGRNRITVNAGQTYAWTSAIPTASTDLNSRGITRGTWRGPNQLYTYNIPTSALRAGTNTIDLPVVSGSSGSGFLSPNVVYDAIDLVPTASITNAPRVQSIALTPASPRIGLGAQLAFTATATDQFGAPIAANIAFATTAGTITPTGLFTAPAAAGTATISATVGAVTASTQITILGAVPIVVSAAAASPSPTATGIVNLSALGDDDAGQANLSYTWSVVGTPPGNVTFAANGTNASRTTTATLSAPGVYNLQVTIADSAGNTVVSQTTATYRLYVARYTADETAGTTLADSSGNNRTAALSGAYTFAPGRIASSLKLTGGSAALPTGVVSGLTDFTIATWVKIDTLSTWSRIFDFGTGQTVNMFLTPRADSGSGPVRFGITTGGGAGEQRISGTAALPAGVWTHVAITLTGNLGILYVNGVEVGRNSAMTLRPSNLGSTTLNYLGKSQYASDPAFLGSLDDFRIYGRPLPASEVLTLATTLAPAVSTFRINDGAAQRSRITSVAVSFSTASVLAPGALSLVRTGGGAVPLTITSSDSRNYTLTFSGTGIVAGSLDDGSYTLMVNAAGVSAAADIQMSASASFAFHRLFGDVNGDAKVNSIDSAVFNTTYGLSSSNPGFLWYLDYDGNGTINTRDMLYFRSRFSPIRVELAPTH